MSFQLAKDWLLGIKCTETWSGRSFHSYYIVQLHPHSGTEEDLSTVGPSQVDIGIDESKLFQFQTIQKSLTIGYWIFPIRFGNSKGGK